MTTKQHLTWVVLQQKLAIEDAGVNPEDIDQNYCCT